MRRKILLWILPLLAALLLTGCAVRTVDQLYQLPKRSEAHDNLQSAIDRAMPGLEYSAPLTGENRQAVQMADLDGDGEQEYLVFAKGTSERPLRILIFRNVDGTYTHIDTVESNGSSFDQVEYAQMERGGLKLVVGRQVSDQVLRSVSVYSFEDGQAERLVTANYTKFLITDLDSNGFGELFVLRPGQSEEDGGVAELYAMQGGAIERSNEVKMSEPADRLKRILLGNLHGGQAAVYVASMVDDVRITTDVYALSKHMLVNVTFSNESGTGIHTLRNYYVYADDVDDDGVVELPQQITMTPLDAAGGNADRQNLIRWYAMTLDGGEVDKMYTYHNFAGGWFLQLEDRLAPRITVLRQGNHYEFYIWSEDWSSTRKLFTVYAYTGQNREEQATGENRFVLRRTELTVFAASLEPGAGDYGFTRERMTESFYLISQDWKTGETS